MNDDGQRIDRAAEAAFEAGYISDKENNTLLDAIDREMRGERIVAQPEQAAEQDFLARQAEKNTEAERRSLVDQVRGNLDEDWNGAKLTKGEMAQVVDAVQGGVDMDTAIERYIGSEADNADREDAGEIPGFEAQEPAGEDSQAGEIAAPDQRPARPDEPLHEDDRREAGEDRVATEQTPEGEQRRVVNVHRRQAKWGMPA